MLVWQIKWRTPHAVFKTMCEFRNLDRLPFEGDKSDVEAGAWGGPQDFYARVRQNESATSRIESIQ